MKEITDALKWVLKIEHDKKDKSGIYGYTQRLLAYNSNKIEGSTLNEKQTTALFEEGYLPKSENIYKTKDVEEMTGHFLMFNKMLTTLDEKLSEAIIKQFHYELKAGVFEDRANGYAIGEYKTRKNMVGGTATVDPEEVPNKMRELLEWYNACSEVTLDILAEFHARYERIHPFQDGNGRTGRIILFRECLQNDIVPFVISDNNRQEYINALSKASEERDYTLLSKLFEREQADYKKECVSFGILERYRDCKGGA